MLSHVLDLDVSQFTLVSPEEGMPVLILIPKDRECIVWAIVTEDDR